MEDLPLEQKYEVKETETEAQAVVAQVVKNKLIEYKKRISNIEEINGDNIIGADGPTSITANMFGFPKIKKYLEKDMKKLGKKKYSYLKVEKAYGRVHL